MNKLFDFIKKLFVRSNAKNIMLLSSGTLISQIIAFLFQPIVTRVYSPEDLGALSVITSFASIFFPVVTLQYHVSVVNSDDKEIHPLLKLNFYIILLTSILVFLGLFIYNEFLSETFKYLGGWIYVSIFILFINGITSTVDSFNNRKNEYKLMAGVCVVRAAVSGVFKVVLGFFKTGFIGLAISYIISLSFGLKRQSKSLIKEKSLIFKSNMKDVISVAKKYSFQPLLALPGIFINQLSYSILPIIILALYGSQECGFFSLTVSILGVPLGVISANVARIFFKNASDEYKEKGNFKTSFLSTSTLLIIISVAGFSLLWLIAEPAFGIIFGSEWIRSGTFTKLLIPMYIARFVVSGLMHGFIITNKQITKLCIQAIFIIEIFAIKYVCGKFLLNIEQFFTLVNWSYMATYIVLFLMLYKISRGNKRLHKGV